jgi:hypothetical protein
MNDRIQIITILASGLLLVVVLELVRRRRLLERYALLWLASSVLLLSLAIWRDVLDRIAAQLGVAYPPNALFIVAFAAVLWLLLHFSVAVSRLNDQTKILAQRLAILEERVRRTEEITALPDAERPAMEPQLAEVAMRETPRPLGRVPER